MILSGKFSTSRISPLEGVELKDLFNELPWPLTLVDKLLRIIVAILPYHKIRLCWLELAGSRCRSTSVARHNT